MAFVLDKNHGYRQIGFEKIVFNFILGGEGKLLKYFLYLVAFLLYLKASERITLYAWVKESSKMRGNCINR